MYGRERLGAFWGFIAGWGFLIGKLASCAAIALTFGTYADPDLRRPLAFIAVAALTIINYLGIRKTAWITRIIDVLVLSTLAVVVWTALTGGTASIGRLGEIGSKGLGGILQSAGLLFFAFAGYARIATLGEEVRNPTRTIPRAIPLALGIILVVYGAVAVSALLAIGPDRLAMASAPLEAVVEAGSRSWLAPAVQVGGAVATLGVLLSLLAGISRTAFAMASDGQLPRWLGKVHPIHRVPHRAELCAGGFIALTVLLVDLRGAIGSARSQSWSTTRLPTPLRGPFRQTNAGGLVGCRV